MTAIALALGWSGWLASLYWWRKARQEARDWEVASRSSWRWNRVAHRIMRLWLLDNGWTPVTLTDEEVSKQTYRVFHETKAGSRR